MADQVYLLQIITKYDLEDTRHIVGRIIKSIQRWTKPGMHAKRNIAFVIVSAESLDDLSARLRPTLLDLQDSGGVERFLFSVAPERVVSDHGQWDPLNAWLREARVEIGKRNQSQRLRDRERRYGRL